jgi:hypothetical protein
MSQAFSIQLINGENFLKTLTWKEHLEFKFRLDMLIKIIYAAKLRREEEKRRERGLGLGVEAA